GRCQERGVLDDLSVVGVLLVEKPSESAQNISVGITLVYHLAHLTAEDSRGDWTTGMLGGPETVNRCYAASASGRLQYHRAVVASAMSPVSSQPSVPSRARARWAMSQVLSSPDRLSIDSSSRRRRSGCGQMMFPRVP